MNKKSFKKNKVFLSVSALVGGGFFAQIIAVAALPILTRIYTPDDFSKLSVFSSLLIMISAFAGLRYETAIPKADSEKQALAFLCISILSSFFISVFVLLLTIVTYFLDLNYEIIEDALWVLPLAIFLFSSCTTLQYWFSRKKRFEIIARTKVTQILSSVVTQLLAGISGLGYMGLIIGQVFNGGGGVVSLYKKTKEDESFNFRDMSFLYIKSEFYSNNNYLKYSTPETIANNGAIHFPIFIIAFYSESIEAGFLFLAMRIIQIPMGILTSSISQVYYVHSHDKNKIGELKEFTIDVLVNLVKFCFAPMFFLGMLSPFFIDIAFGEKWSRTGEIMQWLLIWFLIQVLASPISMVMYTKDKQKEMFFLTLFGFLIRVGSVYFVAIYSSRYLIETYAISGGIFYILCLFVFLKTAGVNLKDVLIIIKRTSAVFFLLTLFLLILFLGRPL